MDLPTFKYHPNPLGTGSVVECNDRCECCRKIRGDIYTGAIYISDYLEDKNICPWCIANGKAAKKFHAEFTYTFALQKAGIDPAIILEIATKTPGYQSFQAEVWLSHCNDACAFLGIASKEDVLYIAAPADATHTPVELVGGEDIDDETMLEIAQKYTVDGGVGIYKFGCLHCNEIMYTFECD
jgi:uncharacterized protein CbrC (UPF0167 family)